MELSLRKMKTRFERRSPLLRRSGQTEGMENLKVFDLRIFCFVSNVGILDL